MVVFEWLFLQFRQHERVDKDVLRFFNGRKNRGFGLFHPKTVLQFRELMQSMWQLDKFDQLQFLNHTML
jgi:hypothetical protein